jgi:hypothetical protein
MAEDDEKSQLELIKQLGERMNALARLHTDSVRQLAERANILGRMHAEAIAQFARSTELTERLAARIAERIRGKLAKA